MLACSFAGAATASGEAIVQRERSSIGTTKPQDEVDSAAAELQKLMLENVIVTAQRRQESVQQVPISITTMNGAQLTNAGIRESSELTFQIPSLQIGDNSDDGAEIFMRGIGSTNDTEVGDPAVAFNMDGVYLGRPAAADALLFDIERIEVLRGPQGTLYGRNATAGAVNVITNKPKQDFESSGELTVANYGTLESEGMLNLPLSRNLAVRAAFGTDSHDGYTNNRNVAAGVTANANDAKNQAARLSALYAPTQNLSLMFSGDYMHQGGVGANQIDFAVIGKSGEAGRTKAFDTQGWRNNVYAGGSIDAELTTGPVKWSSITAYRINDRNDVIDEDGGVTLPAHAGILHSDFHQFSQELRGASNYDSALQWVGGLYYYIEHNNVYFHVTNLAAPGLGLAFIQPDVFEGSAAAFGQLNFKPTDTLTFSAGGRETQDKKYRHGATYLVFEDAGTSLNILTNAANVRYNKFNYTGKVAWQWARDNSLYASVGTGYKAGGYYDGSSNNLYKPENLTAYEIGSKNRFLEGRAQVNASAYYYDYRDFQLSEVTALSADQGLGSVTYNAQKAKAYGMEVEGQVRIGAHDELMSFATYEHTRFDQFTIPAATNPPPCPGGYIVPTAAGLCDLAGDQFQRAPEWVASLEWQHSWDLANGARFSGDARVYWSDSYYTFVVNTPFMQQKSFTRSDLSVTYSGPKERYFFQAFVRNLEDKNIAIQGAFVDGLARAALAPPRTFGVRFGVRLRAAATAE